MPRAFLVRTKPTAVSSDVSHQGVETRNEQGKYLVVIFTRAFFVMVCTIPFNFSRYPPLLRVKDPIFVLISEHILRLPVSHMSDSCCNSEMNFQKILFDSDPQLIYLVVYGNTLSGTELVFK